MKTVLNAKTLKDHLFYNWWKYLLALLAGIFLVDLLFTVTAPRIPENKKVDFYIYGYSDSAALTDYLSRVHETEMADMESVSFNNLTMDDTYGQMQLTTYIFVGEGDLYLLPREDFLSLASSGAFLPLEEDPELMALCDGAGLNLRRGWRTAENEDAAHLYGIPADLLPGLPSYCFTPDGYLAVLSYGGNTENAVKLLRILIRDTLTAPEVPEEASPSPAPEPSVRP